MRAGGQRITFWNGATVMRKIIELNTVIELNTEETKVVAGGLEGEAIWNWIVAVDSAAGLPADPTAAACRLESFSISPSCPR